MFDFVMIAIIAVLVLGVGGFCFIVILIFDERDKILVKWEKDIEERKRKRGL